MFKTLFNKSITVSHTDVRFAFFLLTVVLFVLGAGAPSDGGGFGGG